MRTAEIGPDLRLTLAHKINYVGTYSGGSSGSRLRDAVVYYFGKYTLFTSFSA